MNVAGEKIVDEEVERESVYATDADAPDGYISWSNYMGVLTRLLFIQFGSSVRKSVVDLFSPSRK